MQVRGRKQSKDRNRSDEKKKFRNSSPNTPDISNNTYEQEQAIRELDLVIDSYHGGNTNTMKRNKRHVKELTVQEKNGGTWPKARATNVLQNTDITTVVARTKERIPLSMVINSQNENCFCPSNVNRNSTPVRLSIQPVCKSMDNSAHFLKPFNPLSDSSERLCSINKRSEFGHQTEVPNRLSMNLKSDDSLDFPVNKPTLMTENLMNYCKKTSSTNKYGLESERDSLSHDISNVPPSHTRIHSQLFGPQPRFQPHPHPHLNPSPLNFLSSHSRDSFSFEPQYLPFHSHSPSADVAYPKRPLIPGNIPNHSHIPYRDSDIIPMNYGQGFEGGTFPRKKENPRFRIPSNPSVTSKNSIGKISTGSIERTSERGSPMPIFHVEVLSSGDSKKRNSVPDYCWPQKPLPGELRRVHIDKSNEPLGIQINCPDSGGIFVSTVYDNSLASRVGLQIGDQLLEVCGINMRNATYNLAANVLRQCGNSITMLVQYSPDSKLF